MTPPTAVEPATVPAPTWRERAFVGLQHLLPRRALSRLVHRLTRSRRGWLRRLLTRGFIARFPVDMSEALEPDPYAYPSFNAFFTRALQPGARPQPEDPALITAPADGRIQQADALRGGHVVQAKGRHYSLRALLADDDRAGAFDNGLAITVYLAPFNYHRVHMPIDGVLTAYAHVPGDLFSVNAVTARLVDDLFARNERVICHFDTALGPVAVVLVGAMNVGSIETVWAGEITGDHRDRQVRHYPLAQSGRVRLARGDELGRFNMGSTVIVLLPPGRARLLDAPVAGASVRIGDALARRTGD